MRWTRVAAAAGAAALVAGTAFVDPAPAATRPGIVIALDSPVEITMPRLAANNPVFVANPNICSSTGALSNACDVVPITVVHPPGSDDFFFEITVTWPETVAGSNDIDLALYDNKQRAGNNTTFTEISESRGASDPGTPSAPERIAIVQPDYTTYNLTVNNYSGPNSGYVIKATLQLGEPSDAFELLEPPPEFSEDTGSGAVDEPSAPPEDLSGGFEDFTQEFAFSELGETIDPDLDAAGFAPSGTIGNLPQAPTLPADLLSNEPPGPASGALLFLSLVAVPAILAGAGTFLVLRNRRSAFGFAA